VATGQDWLINWADFPSVQPLGEKLWAAHWLVRREEGGYAYDIAIAVSRDGGMTWSESVQPHLDDGAVEHGFVSLYEEAGRVGAVWLDGRNTVQGGATQLRSAMLDAQNHVVGDTVVADRVCDCCQTDIAVSRDGPVLVYRGRTGDEIRDIHVALRRGGRWLPGSKLAADNWQISGCPVNGPAIDAVDNTVAVAWYTAHPDKRVQVAFSLDGGVTFTAPVDVNATQTMGRVDVVTDASGNAVVSWLQRGKGRLVARRVTASGELGPIREIAPMAVNRDSGFPQMIRQGDGLVFAWTDASKGQSLVRTAYVDSI
jgi:hypothetical protein